MKTRRTRGFSMVELLVAMLISLIGTIVIFQVYAVSEGYKRTTTGGGEAQNNGAIGLFTVERDIRQAGYGINNLAFLGCTINGWDTQASPSGPITLTLAPVVITQGAAGAPDTITVMYGNTSLLPNPATLTAGMPTPASTYKINNRYGFNPGDLVISAQAGQPCTLAQVSVVPGTPGHTDEVNHDPGNYGTPPVPTRYNNPSGLPAPNNISYATGASLFDLGASPSNNVYSVQNGQLMLQQMLSSTPGAGATAINDGIVQLQAQYGKDTNNDGIVDTFDEVTPTTAAGWAQVLAIRLALVARSTQYEKDPVSPATINLLPALNPPPSTAIPTAPAVDWNLASTDRNYRYKVFQTVVPIRNMIWRPS